MNFIVYGTSATHKKGEFCNRVTFSHYFISCFLTDYIVEANGALIRGSAGDYIIIEPGQIVYHGSVSDSETGFINDWIYVGGEDLTSLLKRYPLPLGTPFRVSRTSILRNAIDEIHKEKSFCEIGANEKCDFIMANAIIDLFRDFIKNDRLSPEEKIKRTRGEIMVNYMKPWKLFEMAKACGYSESRFSALYKELYGISPITDLINKRIEQAKLLMLYGDMPLSEISECVGFSSLYYFSKYFKKKEGVSPSEYKSTRR
jgi:AraC family transcriptional regulator of arabinose operon